ncbi:MAG: OB-fold nucleic acid binding domain-containing protein, partial [Casimicrobium sp.]
MNTSANDTHSASPQEENHIIAERRAKLTALREKGQAFPNDFRREHLAADLVATYGEKTKEELEALNATVTIAGRMMLKRVMGGASFATVQDMSGRIQLYINDAGVGAETHEAFKHWDMGDILGATGTMFKTQKGELSIKVKSLRLLTKSLRPLPEKFHGLTDTEMKYRQRYVDLIMNPESRRTFEIRSKMIAFIRNFYVQRGYL